jgi:glycosyltransferase involved in cell wall biosynthesis
MPERVTKVLHLIDSSRRGGGQMHARRLLETLAGEELELHLASPADGDAFDGIERAGVIRHKVALSKLPSPRSFARLVRLLGKLSPDILHLHGSLAGVWGRLASLFARDTQVVYTYHGVHYLRERVFPRSVLFYAADRMLCGLSDRIIAVSAADRDLLVKAGLVPSGGVRVIPNGIDVRGFLLAGLSRTGSVLTCPEGCRYVVTVARLHRQKGHAYLLHAAVKILEKFPQTMFLLLGDGPERRALRALARRLRIFGQVSFLGEREDVAEIVSRADVFVLPSLWEGMPLSMLEAALLRIPMVLSDVPGIREVFTAGEHALLVPAADPGAIAEAVERIFTGSVDVKRMTGEAAQVVVREHGIEIMAERTVRLYRELAGRTQQETPS